MSIEIIGVKATIENLSRINQRLSNMDGAMKKATTVVTASAKRKAPVDTGLLRASITPSVKSSGKETIGIVGSNVKYAPFMELGTRPHFPPIAALETWARRHGMSAYVVCRAIARRGLRARRYLGRALDENVRRISRIFADEVKRIVK
jgi:HK97 gp10 family phage protein